MCGIVGYIGVESAKEILFSGLQKLEYRGYDSAGVAILEADGVVNVLRSQGKLSELAKILYRDEKDGHVGIGHTRWATHGRPSVPNAHPHRADPITVVHNGIIENYTDLKGILGKEASDIKSETDTEVLAHLIKKYFRQGMTTLKALYTALSQVRGSYALAILSEKEPDSLYVARRGSPLIVARKDGEGFVASDIQAILPYTKEYYILEDGDCGIVRRDGLEIYNSDHEKVSRKLMRANWDHQEAEKGGYRHFMLKEIFEQPVALVNTIKDRLSPDLKETYIPELKSVKKFFKSCERIYIIACGTAFHASSFCRELYCDFCISIRRNGGHFCGS